jgi:RNA binding exosome subunit
MELKEFLEKFLPDYEERYEEGMTEAPGHYGDDHKKFWIFNYLFSETLQNFADKICEKQRDNCVEYLEGADKLLNENGDCYSCISSSEWLEDAEQPKIEEL